MTLTHSHTDQLDTDQLDTGRSDNDQLDTDRFDAVIIGAGIFGCGIAFELARRGLRVCAVDMNAGPGQGSTSSSGAIIRFQYSTVAGTRLAWEGNHYWENFAEYLETPAAAHEGGIAHKITTGNVMLRTDESLHALYLENLAAAGVRFEELSAEQVVERYPFLTMARYEGPCLPDDPEFWADPNGEIPGALYLPDAGYVSDPMLAAQNLYTAAMHQGATFRFGARVEALTLDATDGAPGERVEPGAAVTGVRLRGGESISAPIVVNVGGPWSSMVNAFAGVGDSMAIGTRPMRHEAHQASSPDELDFNRAGTIVTDLNQGMYFRPAPGNQIFVGSADPACDGHDWVSDMDALHRETTEPAWTRQMMRLAKRMPVFAVPNQRRGLAEAYDVSDDWGPIYDRSDIDGYFMAIGTSGNQFKNACVASHLMAELIMAVTDGHDHDREPLVVEGRFTGTPIDMGAFSRNRTINENSTGTVMG